MANSTGLVSLSCSADQSVAVAVGIVVNDHDFGPTVAKLSRSGSANLCRLPMTVASLSGQALDDIGPAVAASQALLSLSGTVLRADWSIDKHYTAANITTKTEWKGVDVSRNDSNTLTIEF